MTKLHSALQAAAATAASKRKRRAHEEHSLQASVFSQLQMVLPADAIIVSVDHAGDLSAVTRALMKRRGIENGLPDTWVYWSPEPSAHRLIVLAMELKARKGRIKQTQHLWREALEGIGAYWAAPRSPEEAFDAVRAAGIPLSGRII